MTPLVLDTTAIKHATTPGLVLTAVRDTLIAHAHGRTTVPSPLHLQFPEADGDCHVKAGWVTDTPDFTVKIATGFYRNPAAGLPTNHGLVCVVSARTGQICAILDDQGLLTAWRTAAAGALATHAMARPDAATLAVFGTGEQARLQVEWLARLRPIDTVLVHGRSQERARSLCAEFDALGLHARPASAGEAAAADMVLTTTPATAPVLQAGDVRAGAHVTGIGTDMPHKNELPPALFARAALIATDDHQQCLDHGDFGHAVRAGTTTDTGDTPVGLLLDRPVERTDGAITVADLTGLGALDAALASAVLRELAP
ncbi:ornithine cyclodeaminase family protein [Streptomyces sp. NBC_00257]|uniref:ornithine cyclodeaminase family protein n=1 Tax=unclassified Streptomyces TaxID=2593676 RepID=UPI002257AAA7|nr:MULTISPECIES: ornithine cyclodeaminase family protein [unclassified Streptomyces]MCX4870986.1 ornithine cyclodeaminase family protein [Streptomyces sp. NBC_00906]MCX4901726.1 ornithine cyclodeaminase family protein [Streptomyces sp. NBC_00892]MCX5426968.1 ornithine cyclodeaminase family protein [Streptomyces sp. NBC_00062]